MLKIRLKQCKAFLLYIIMSLYNVFSKKKYDDTWLISERGDEARDNGYWFYKYLVENHPEIDVRYCITKNSIDKHKIDKKHIIIHGSLEHFKAFLQSKILISTHIMGYSPNFRLFTKLDKKNLIHIRGKKVLLQHGITKDYISLYDSKNVNLDLFISGAKLEYKYLIERYGFSKDIVKYTGFSRYDQLYRKYDSTKKSNQILIMPTWRTWLYKINTADEFQKTQYFKEYLTLLTDERIHKILNQNGYKIIFYPHYEIQKWMYLFKSQNISSNVILAEAKEYDVQQLLIESDILITDYSSIFFDFAYMKKPLIYFQFDVEEYRERQYSEGYFKYDNGFGPLVGDMKSLISNLDKILTTGMENKYQLNQESFFTLKDDKNSERIFNSIKNIVD